MTHLERFVAALRAGVPVDRLRARLERRALIASRARWLRFLRDARTVH